MRNSLRFTGLFLGLVLFAGSAIRTAGQTVKSEPSPFSSQATPGYTKASPVPLGSVAAAKTALAGPLLIFPPNAKSSREVFMRNNAAGAHAGPNTAAGSNDTGGVPRGATGNIPGLDTLPTFAGAFAAQGGPSAGNVFPYIMIGNDPALGGKTEIS